MPDDILIVVFFLVFMFWLERDLFFCLVPVFFPQNIDWLSAIAAIATEKKIPSQNGKDRLPTIIS